MVVWGHDRLVKIFHALFYYSTLEPILILLQRAVSLYNHQLGSSRRSRVYCGGRRDRFATWWLGGNKKQNKTKQKAGVFSWNWKFSPSPNVSIGVRRFSFCISPRVQVHSWMKWLRGSQFLQAARLCCIIHQDVCDDCVIFLAKPLTLILPPPRPSVARCHYWWGWLINNLAKHLISQ